MVLVEKYDAAGLVMNMHPLAQVIFSGAVPVRVEALLYGTHLVYWPREDQNQTAQAASLSVVSGLSLLLRRRSLADFNCPQAARIS